ncbi:recombinase family protein [Bradyrhizobium sp. ARR65]|uniref:recombinase family protein n=1 Tax=Bradyrhizobium sp. ARR65 TaxID=1040989 RepID=UPI00055193A0|nr:recombinase family protein [Bradyrhizobium sp. ARR65]
MRSPGPPIYGDVANGSEGSHCWDAGATGMRGGAGCRFAPTIKALQEAGATSLRAIADGLNAQGIPTARGSGQWPPTQVARLIERL